MSQPVAGPIYYRIAADLAARIVRGDIREGERLSGRSMLVGSYGVSSETIRRALNLLSEQGIVEVVPGSGVRVISRQKAMAYVERVGMVTDLRSLRREVTDILEEQNDLNRRMQELVDKIFDLSERLKNREPIRGYDFELPKGSPIVGSTLGELRMRQKTGATLIAIKRGEQLIVSPGPKQGFLEEDVLVIAAASEDIPRFKQFLATGLGTPEEEK
jgi:K+/H+ antiporter YhaU regulatory subunit KhtT